MEPTLDPDLRRKLKLGDDPIVLSVSAQRPHKNLPRLLRALAARLALVVPGYPTPHERGLRALAAELDIADRCAPAGLAPGRGP